MTALRTFPAFVALLLPGTSPGAPSSTPSADAEPSPSIRFLLPNPPLELPGSRELDAVWGGLIDEYNSHRRPSGAPSVQLVRRGEHFSSLKELIALHLAGAPPEIAAVETSELPALDRTGLARTIPSPLLRELGLPGKSTTSLPFQRSIPILVANQEALPRAGSKPLPLPRDWKGLKSLVTALAPAAPDRASIALPLQGPRGLWLFESLADAPLWTREAGGLRTNRELEAPILAIQSLQASPSELSWDRAVQSFLERRSPLLATSLDALPLIARRAPFAWTAGPLPLPAPHPGAKAGPVAAGSDLIVTRDHPGVWAFIAYLYSREAGARWSSAGGLLPLRADWLSRPEWKQASPAYRALATPPGVRVLAPRTTDRDVVRAHSEWVSALHHLFGDPARRLPIEGVFTRLDSAQAPR